MAGVGRAVFNEDDIESLLFHQDCYLIAICSFWEARANAMAMPIYKGISGVESPHNPVPLVAVFRLPKICSEGSAGVCLLAEPSQAALEGPKDATTTHTVAAVVACAHRVPPLFRDPPQRVVGALPELGDRRRVEVRADATTSGARRRRGAVLGVHHEVRARA